MLSSLKCDADTSEVVQWWRAETEDLLVVTIKEVLDLTIDREPRKTEEVHRKRIRNRHICPGVHGVRAKSAQRINIITVTDDIKIQVEGEQVIRAA